MSFTVIRRPRRAADTAAKSQRVPQILAARSARPILHLKSAAAD